MVNIAIFGGTGMTGECAVEHALQKGKSVRLLYRTEDTIQKFKDRVELVQGDVTNVSDVEKNS